MLAEAVRRVWLESRSFVAPVRAGLVGIEPPRRLLSMLRAQRDFGPVGAAPHNAALRYGSCRAIADEPGELTFAELRELGRQIEPINMPTSKTTMTMSRPKRIRRW